MNKGARHHWLTIATVREDENRALADTWHWCALCGTLSLNKREFWPSGRELYAQLTHRKGCLPAGASKAPQCVPR